MFRGKLYIDDVIITIVTRDEVRHNAVLRGDKWHLDVDSVPAGMCETKGEALSRLAEMVCQPKSAHEETQS